MIINSIFFMLSMTFAGFYVFCSKREAPWWAVYLLALASIFLIMGRTDTIIENQKEIITLIKMSRFAKKWI